MSDCVFPLVFPDYLIAVDRPSINVDLPDFLPFDDQIEDFLDDDSVKVPHLGHAGVLFIKDNGSTGTTKYYEYGRYITSKGEARRKPMPDCAFKNGKPEKQSLMKVFQQISRSSGQNGRISGAYIETPGKYSDMLSYSMLRVNQNKDPNRREYNLLNYSCNTFVAEVMRRAGVDFKMDFTDSRPVSFINSIKKDHTDVDYEKGKLYIEDNLF